MKVYCVQGLWEVATFKNEIANTQLMVENTLYPCKTITRFYT